MDHCPDRFIVPRSDSRGWRPPWEEAPLRLLLTGQFGCFVHPALKVEALSHECMTPSAGFRLPTTLYGKPETEYVLHRIWVLSPIRFHRDIRKHLKTKTRRPTDEDRTLRSTRYLLEPAYLLELDIHPNLRRLEDGGSLARRGGSFEAARRSFLDEARTRIGRGERYQTPVLGRASCRAEWRLLGDSETTTSPIDVSMDLGAMLLDVIPSSTGRNEPVFCDARLDHGVLHVPLRRWMAEVLPRKLEFRRQLPHSSGHPLDVEARA